MALLLMFMVHDNVRDGPMQLRLLGTPAFVEPTTRFNQLLFFKLCGEPAFVGNRSAA
jgi:hypothetical protein